MSDQIIFVVNRTDKDVLIADIAIPKKGYRILQEKGDE